MKPPHRELLLLRHAKSDWKTPVDSDFERPLSKRGKRDAPRVGEWLHRQGLLPDRVISSPAARAHRTADKACKVLGIEENHIHWEPQIYDADIRALLNVLATCPQQFQRVLLTGHNPGLEGLLIYLCGSMLEHPADGKLLPTATVARIRMPLDWQSLPADAGHLLSLTRPVEMDK